MVNKIFAPQLDQLAEIVFLDECIFSVKSFKHMTYTSTGENIQQSEIL